MMLRLSLFVIANRTDEFSSFATGLDRLEALSVSFSFGEGALPYLSRRLPPSLMMMLRCRWGGAIFCKLKLTDAFFPPHSESNPKP